MRVALIHYWLVGMRGGEYVLEQFSDMFPDADIFTHVVDRTKISKKLLRHRIFETSIGRLPGAIKHYQKYLMLMPKALEEIDLRGYDLVISSESGPAKGVTTSPGTPHICYTHSPMRYIWDLYPAYREGLRFPAKQVFSATAHRLRQWDFASAQRVDHVVANSNFVASRIQKYWRRDAEVLNPPVDLSRFRVAHAAPQDFYLFVSELVPYKRADIAVEAFRKLGRKLLIVGSGPDYKKLRDAAPSNVEFLGRVDNAGLEELYKSCRALIFPGEEDFGIVPLEAMASGRPVIAFGKGGLLDTVVPGKTGRFFTEQTSDALAEAVLEFEREDLKGLSSKEIAAHAQGFSPQAFQRKMMAIISRQAPHLVPGDVIYDFPIAKNSA